MDPLHPVDSLIRRLAAQPSPTSADLGQLLREVDHPELLLDLARFADDRYVRTALFQGRDHEIRLLGWKPGQSSTLHGHGPSACAFRVLAGVATELRLDGTSRQLRPGDIAADIEGAVHQVGNLGDQPLVTLHLYAPPLPVDQPSGGDGHRVAIVGGGVGGVAVAIHLLRSGDPDLRLTLIEQGPHVGRGADFATSDPAHSCRFAAGAGSLDPDDPGDLVGYAIGRGVPTDPSTHLPRGLYGDYVVDRLGRAIGGHPGKLRLLRAEAVDLEGREDGFQVQLADGRSLLVDEVVLAASTGPREVPAGLQGLGHDSALIRDPLRPGALGRLPRSARLLLVGTGPAAVDVLLTLRAEGHHGPIVVVGTDWSTGPMRPIGPALDRWQLDGWVDLRPTAIASARRERDGAVVALADGSEVRVDRVALCTDPVTDVTRIDSRWWRSLLRRRWVRFEDGRVDRTRHVWSLAGPDPLPVRAQSLARAITHSRSPSMSLHLGAVAPDFTSDSTFGPIRFHAWSQGHWVVLFSHPADFTPVCTTEIAAASRLLGAFAQRNAKILALSVDPLERHLAWAVDIEQTQGVAPNFPILADPERVVSRLYGMIPADAPDALTVRSVFFVDPRHRIRATLTYPASTGRNFEELLRVLDSLQLTDDHRVATPANWSPGDDVVIVPSVVDPTELADRFPKGFRAVRPWLRITPQP